MPRRPSPFAGDTTPSSTASTRGRARITNASGIQRHLRQAGYQIPISGEMDDLTKSAIEDYQSGSKKRNPKKWNYMNAPLKPGKPGPQATWVPGPRTAKNPDGRYTPTRKPGSPPRAPAGNSGGSVGNSGGSGPAVAPGGAPAMDYGALASSMGIDPALFRGLNPRVGNLIPLALARGGAKTMGSADIDQLVKTLVGDTYSRQESLMSQERSRMEAQNKMNLSNISGWYDQVLQSQGVARERDAAFGQAAVGSMTDATADIVSSLGGEANQGSYVAGAAGAEAVGNLNAVSQIQNQYNADMAPLLQAEGAGQMAREQAAGSSRSRDLAMRLQELQSGRGTAEAELRFNLWQANNEIMNQRLQNELAIRGQNTGLRQQQFNNRVGLRQMMMAAQAGAAGNVVDVASVAQRDAEARADAQNDARKQSFAERMAVAEEAGRNYRAQLSASGRKKEGTYAQASSDTRDSAWNDIVDVIEGQELTPERAKQIAVAVVGGYGWSAGNAAVQALITSALREAGY